MKVLILDNYDSFTWNLVHGLEAAGGRCSVFRSDAIAIDAIRAFQPERIVLSPGPFDPSRSGVCAEAVRAFGGEVSILGVCLGMQVIAAVAGAAVIPSGQPVHGKTSPVHHDGTGIFRGLPDPFDAARYHSLVVDPVSLPEMLTVSAWSPDGTIMAFRTHRGMTEGVLFHPESFLTEQGPKLFSNFLAQ